MKERTKRNAATEKEIFTREVMVQNGEDVNVVTEDKWTPLQIAAREDINFTNSNHG